LFDICTFANHYIAKEVIAGEYKGQGRRGESEEFRKVL
jgi:hypothetical protein